MSDYTYFTAKWFDALAAHPGLTAFATPFADYAPLYLYGLKLLTFVPVYSLYSIKTLSVIFDIAIAALTCLMLGRTLPQRYAPSQLFFIFALMLSIPTVLINSSLWGQADATYAAFVMLCLYYILLDEPLWAALAMGVALCFKVQAVFFVPVLVGYYAREKNNLWYLVLLPLIYFASILPAWLGGGSLAGLLAVYGHQAGEYTGLNISSQSIFAFTDNFVLSSGAQTILFWAGIAASLGIAVWVALRIAMQAERPAPPQLIFWSLLCVAAVPYFLPRMHERYFYLADVLSVIYALYRPRQWYLAVLVVGASLLAYLPYLSGQVAWLSWAHIDLRAPSLMLAAALALLLFLQERSGARG